MKKTHTEYGNNKKRMLLLCLTLCIFSVSGCSNEADTKETSEISDNTVTEIMQVSESISEPVSESEETSQAEPEGVKKASAENFPVTDGSTSTIPLDAAVKAAYLGGFTAEELEPYIIHHKTYNSFENLIRGDADAVYSVPLSEKQINLAKENEFVWESIPVAKEAFVFIVNADNPVDSLTSDQLRRIYSGEITNWSEVGGNDAEISLYLRNENSGSGSYFREFMGDTPAASGERVYKVSDMGTIANEIASFENGINSIGFSVFSYITEMYKSSDNLKMIAVDGVPADKENIIADTYPLRSYTYFIYSAAEPEDSEVRKLADFIVSDKGQEVVESCGYMRVN